MTTMAYLAVHVHGGKRARHVLAAEWLRRRIWETRRCSNMARLLYWEGASARCGDEKWNSEAHAPQDGYDGVENTVP